MNYLKQQNIYIVIIIHWDRLSLAHVLPDIILGESLGTLLQPTTRGQSRLFGFTLRDLACHPSVCSQWPPSATKNISYTSVFFWMISFGS